MSNFLYEKDRGSLTLTLLIVLGVLGVLNVLTVLYVLNMPMDASCDDSLQFTKMVIIRRHSS